MPHLHLSVQAGDDLILKRMKRRHSPRRRARSSPRARAACAPASRFGADLIAGFPTETEAMFARTLQPGRRGGARPSSMSSPIRPRPGTPAARMPQVPARACAERAARLRAAAPRRWRGAPRPGRPVASACWWKAADAACASTRARSIRTGAARRIDAPRHVAAHATARLSAGGSPAMTPERLACGASQGGLARSSRRSRRHRRVVRPRRLDDAALAELEELLIAADLGARSPAKLVARSSAAPASTRRSSTTRNPRRARRGDRRHPAAGRPAAAHRPGASRMWSWSWASTAAARPPPSASWPSSCRDDGQRVMLAAGDTFRAAAVEQLKIWGERAGAPVIAGDPGRRCAPGWPSTRSRRPARDGDRRAADRHRRPAPQQGRTDGRAAEDRARAEEARPAAPHDVLLVLDATVGQNALRRSRPSATWWASPAWS